MVVAGGGANMTVESVGVGVEIEVWTNREARRNLFY